MTIGSNQDSTLARKATPKRRKLDLSLIIGVVLILLFISLFVLEFSRILSMAGKVEVVGRTRSTQVSGTP
jgi:hypothetical protein